jgi:hypothetical protein
MFWGDHRFASLPRINEQVLIHHQGRKQVLQLVNVIHIAACPADGSPSVAMYGEIVSDYEEGRVGL